MNDIHQAVKLGMACRRSSKEYAANFKNPYERGTFEFLAWQAGYENNLQLWIDTRMSVEVIGL